MSMTKPIVLCKFNIEIHYFSNHPLSPFHLIPFLVSKLLYLFYSFHLGDTGRIFQNQNLMT